MRGTRLLATAVMAAMLVVVVGCGSEAKPEPSDATFPAGQHGAITAKKHRRAAHWTTYHGNLARTGVDTTSPPLRGVHRTWTRSLDAPVYGEPLAVGKRVYVATENNTVYALSARSGRVAWRRHLGAPVDASTLPCGNILPVTGVTGTPAISRGRLYVVAFRKGYRHTLFALRLKGGKVQFKRAIDAPGSDPKVQQQRSAMSISKGRVYVPYGGLAGDCGDYEGRVVSVRTKGKAGLRSFTVGVRRKGAIWAPSGAAVNRAGSLFVATGNGDEAPGLDMGNSVIRLTPKLAQADFYRASNSAQLDQTDSDLGSVGPTLLGGNRLFAIGKEGLGLLLDASHLGGTGGQLFSQPVCDGGAFGGLAYRAPFVYVPCADGLAALRLSGDSFSVAWRAGSSAGAPIISGGAVWTIHQDGTLHAYAPDSGHELASLAVGAVTHFPSPGAGGGRLFVPAQSQVVAFAGV